MENGYTAEPIYANVQKDIGDVTDIDARVINFLNVVRDAPSDIQTLTDNFLATVDRLKRQYISNIVKTKVAERNHSAVEDYVGTVVDEYHTMVRKDSYLDQVCVHERNNVSEKLEMAKLELGTRFCQLQLALRELELSKEKLGRLSKRAEHVFMSNLRKHPETGWVEVYLNDADPVALYRKQEVVKPPKTTAVFPKPPLPTPHGDCKCCRRDVCGETPFGRRGDMIRHTQTLGRIKNTTTTTTTTSLMRPLRKTESLDTRLESTHSSDEEFPAPPPPLTPAECVFDDEVPFNIVSTGKTKRLSDRSGVSDRSAVDEGIGDIDWNPSQGTSICGSELDEKQRIDDIDEDEQSVSSDYVNRRDVCQENDEISDASEIVIYDDVIVDLPSEADGTKTENTSTQDGGMEKTEIVTPSETTTTDSVTPSNVIMTAKIDDFEQTPLPEKKRPNIPLEVNVLNSNDVEQSLTAATPTNSRKTVKISVSASDVSKDGRHNRSTDNLRQASTRPKPVGAMVTDEILTQRLMELKTTDVSDDSRRCVTLPSERESKRHEYEDRSFVQTMPQKQKKDKPKKKKKLQFLTKVFRGPWEGWESD